MRPFVPLTLCLCLSLAPAAPALAAESETPKVLVLGLEPAGVAPDSAKVLDGMVASALSPYRTIEVVTSEDLAQMMELEGQRQQLGCDTSSCLAEIAGAIGARYVVFGSAGRLGDLFVVQLNLFDSVEAKAVARRELQAAALDELAPLMRPAVRELVAGVTDEVLAEEGAVAAETLFPGPLLLTGAGVAGAGAVIGAAGAAGLGVALLTLDSPDADRAGKDVAVGLAPTSIGALVVGGVVLVGGVALALVALGVE